MTSLDRSRAIHEAAVKASKAEIAGLMEAAEEALRALIPHANGEKSLLGEMRSRLEVDRGKLVEEVKP